MSETTCLKSDPAINAASSEKTFCAGGKNGEGPCQGDSGGGLVLKQDNKWHLRGLVSAAPSNGFGTCDTNKFVVFTDVAKLLPWIKSKIFKNPNA